MSIIGIIVVYKFILYDYVIVIPVTFDTGGQGRNGFWVCGFGSWYSTNITNFVVGVLVHCSPYQPTAFVKTDL